MIGSALACRGGGHVADEREPEGDRSGDEAGEPQHARDRRSERGSARRAPTARSRRPGAAARRWTCGSTPHVNDIRPRPAATLVWDATTAKKPSVFPHCWRPTGRRGGRGPVSHNPWVAVDATTIPAKRARELRDAWEDFVDGRETDERGSPAPRRSATRSPTPGCARATRASTRRGRQAAPSVVELRGRPRRSGTTTRSRSPPRSSSECMARASVEADHLIVVSDADGMLLSIRGDTRLRNRAADDMNFVEGALWSEAGAGTNAVGTALAAEHAVQVFAAEHFTEPVQRWTCAAAPVTDPDTGAPARRSSTSPATWPACTRTASRSSSPRRARSRSSCAARAARARRPPARALRQPAAARSRPGPRSSPRSGRVLLDPTQHWSLGGTAHDPGRRRAARAPVGRSRPSPSRSRTATPIVVRPRAQRVRVVPARARAAPPRRRAARGRASTARRSTCAAATSSCSPCSRCTAGRSPPTCCAPSSTATTATRRASGSRCRACASCCTARSTRTRYGLVCDVDSDLRARARAARPQRGRRRRGRLPRAAAAAFSDAPGIEREREELDGWLRQAVITSDDADALWSWVRSPSGDDDLVAWQRLLAALDYADPRRSLAAARTAALRRSSRVAGM